MPESLDDATSFQKSPVDVLLKVFPRRSRQVRVRCIALCMITNTYKGKNVTTNVCNPKSSNRKQGDVRYERDVPNCGSFETNGSISMRFLKADAIEMDLGYSLWLVHSFMR